MARSELQVSHPGVPRELDRYLVPSEKIIFQVRHHWLTLWRPGFSLFLGTLVIGGVYGSIPENAGVVADVLAVAWLLLLGWFLWELFYWYRDWFVSTDRRLMKTMGILTRKVAMMPLAKVTDMKYERTPAGRILGYGTFVLESAGQDQALSTIKYVPNSDVLYRRINEVLFSNKGAAPAARPAPQGSRLPVQEPNEAWWRRR